MSIVLVEMMKENLCFGQFGDANANIIESLTQNQLNGARREKRFSCRFCDYTSANGSHVKRHELRHTGRFGSQGNKNSHARLPP